MTAPTLTSTRVLHPRALAIRELFIGDETAIDATTGAFGWGVTPVDAAARVTFTQTYSTAATTIAAVTAVAVATTGASTSTPYGYTSAAQADAIVTNLNAVIADHLDSKKNINKIIDALQALGIVL